VLENDDGTLYVRTPPEGLTVAEDRFANCRAGILAATPSIYSEKLKLPSTDEKVAFVEEYCHPYADPDPMMPVFYTAEEADVMGMLQSDMRTYIERRTSEWIINGKVDGLAVSWVNGESYIANYPELAMTNFHFDYTSDGTVIAMKKGEDELTAKVNEILEKGKNTEGLYQGWYDEAVALAESLGIN